MRKKGPHDITGKTYSYKISKIKSVENTRHTAR